MDVPKPKRKYERKKPKAAPRLTEHEARVLQATVVEGKTLKATAAELGTTISGVQATKNRVIDKARRAPELLDAAGLPLQTVIEEHLKPLLSAKETRFFPHDVKEIVEQQEPQAHGGSLKRKQLVTGYVIEERTVEANDIRLRATDMALKLHGAYPKGDNGEGVPQGFSINIAMLDPQRAAELLEALDRVEVSRGLSRT